MLASGRNATPCNVEAVLDGKWTEEGEGGRKLLMPLEWNMYLGNREMEEGLVVWAAGRSLDQGRGHETHRQMTGILDGRGKELRCIGSQVFQSHLLYSRAFQINARILN